jgi:hypothetical protein
MGIPVPAILIPREAEGRLDADWRSARADISRSCGEIED